MFFVRFLIFSLIKKLDIIFSISFQAQFYGDIKNLQETFCPSLSCIKILKWIQIFSFIISK